MARYALWCIVCAALSAGQLPGAEKILLLEEREPGGARAAAAVAAYSVRDLGELEGAAKLALPGQGRHLLVLTQKGEVWAWGANESGQLGTGGTSPQAGWVRVPGLDEIAAIAAGAQHGVALRSDGTVFTWGSNYQGQLGNGTLEPRYLPAPVAGLDSVIAIGAGADFTAALRRDGSVWVFGSNWGGLAPSEPLKMLTRAVMVLGPGAALDIRVSGAQVEYKVSGETWATLGSTPRMAAATQGILWPGLEGRNRSVRLEGAALLVEESQGQADRVELARPPIDLQVGWTVAWIEGPQPGEGGSSEEEKTNLVTAYGAVPGGEKTALALTPERGASPATSIAAGQDHILYRKPDGTVWAWGGNQYGQIGDGTLEFRTLPTQVLGLSGVDSVSTKRYHNLALKTDGTVWAWGQNGFGQLGIGGIRGSQRSPVQVFGLTGVVAVSAGVYHSLAVRSDGTVWAWGNGASGELGTGSQSSSDTPVQVSGLTGIVAVSAGTTHNLALKNDGTVWAWGNNSNGQVGDGTTESRFTPVQVSGLTGVTGISAGELRSFAHKSDGSLWAWGYNGGGLGDGTQTDRLTPTQITSLSSVTLVRTNSNHTLVLRSDGTVRTWGLNTYGELGDGTVVPRNFPVQAAGVTAAAAVAAGVRFSVVLKLDGSIQVWGVNWFGQVGNGTAGATVFPVQYAGITGVSSISLGYYHALALKNGEVWSWGGNGSGQLGDGTLIGRSTSALVSGLSNVAAVAAGSAFSLALRNDGTVWSWGENTSGQLGDGTTNNRAVPAQISGLSSVVAIAAGGFHALALRNDGTVWAWGLNAEGQLGDGTTSNRLTPVQITGLTGITAISASSGHSLARKNDGTVWAWGSNTSGQLGDGTVIQRSTPAPVAGLSGIVSIAAGGGRSFAVAGDGSVWFWGRLASDTSQANSYSPETNAPIKINAPTGLATISAGQSHQIALRNDGTLWTWGDNQFGQLGDGTSFFRPSPQKVSLPQNALSMSAGAITSAAVLTDGSVWVWGSNEAGLTGAAGAQYLTATLTNLGAYAVTPAAITASASAGSQAVTLSTDAPTFGWTASSTVPWLTVNPLSGTGAGSLTLSWTANTSVYERFGSVTVAGKTVTVRQAAGAAAPVVRVAAGDGFHLHLKNDGTVWAWGRNSNSQLGNGNQVDQPAPVRVGSLTTVVELAAGQSHALARRSNGTVWAWGANQSGQVGNGAFSSAVASPVQVSGLTGVVAIAAGGYHSLALKSDGTVWAWGSNGDGQLGDGTGIDRNLPVQVTGLSQIVAIAAGSLHSLALRSDGTVMAWGWNASGQLGDGTTESRFSPVAVNLLTDVVAVAASATRSHALRRDGTIWIWGSGLSNDALSPFQLPGSADFVRLATGGFGSAFTFAAVKSDGSVWTWDSNYFGQAGDPSIRASSVPVQVLGITAPASLAIGFDSMIAVRADGTVWGWGQNGFGQTGTGIFGDRTTPVIVSGVSGAAKASASWSHVLILKNNGSLWAWGDHNYKRVSDPELLTGTDKQPVEIVEVGAVTAMAAGFNFSLSVRTNSTVWAWGRNSSGQLGDGTTNQRLIPVAVSGLTQVVAVAAGLEHGLALRTDGTVWAWGANDYGQLGDGTTTRRLTPIQVPGLTQVKAIAAGAYHSLALKTDGTVWAWGENGSGQLGDGTDTRRLQPVQVPSITSVASIWAGESRSIGIRSDGSVWEWGSGAPNVPTRLDQVSSGSLASIGRSHSLVLRSFGDVLGWGENDFGQLGNGTRARAFSDAPVATLGLNSVVSIAAGDGFSVAVRSDGTVWSWGRNDSGQLAQPGGSYLTPVQTVNLGSYVLSPTSLNVPATAGSSNVSLTTTTPLQPWAPVSSAPAWLSATPATGSSNATLSVQWQQNPNTSPRTATITLANQTVTVTQAAASGPPPLRFVSVTPCRVVDTRGAVGPFGGPHLAGNTVRSFPVPQSSCGIPSTAQAYSLNVTVVPRGPLGWLTLWPTGQTQPTVSTLNSLGGDVLANAAIVPAGTGGAVSVFVTNATDVIIDINGYFDPSAGSSFYVDTPCRVVDTRWATGTFGGPILGTAQTRTFPVPQGVCPIASNATAYAANFTVVPSGFLGYLTTWPGGSSQPPVSTLNSWNGRVVANAAVVPAGTNGSVSVFASNPTHVLMDVNGHFGPAGGAGALSFYPVSPCRVLDTRNAAGPLGGPILSANSTRSFPVTQSACGIPTTAKAYSVNVTVVPAGSLPWLTMWPAGASQPVVSTLNSFNGAVIANAAIVPAGTNGAVSVFVAGTTHLILDVNGYFQ